VRYRLVVGDTLLTDITQQSMLHSLALRAVDDFGSTAVLAHLYDLETGMDTE